MKLKIIIVISSHFLSFFPKPPPTNLNAFLYQHSPIFYIIFQASSHEPEHIFSSSSVSIFFFFFLTPSHKPQKNFNSYSLLIALINQAPLLQNLNFPSSNIIKKKHFQPIFPRIWIHAQCIISSYIFPSPLPRTWTHFHPGVLPFFGLSKPPLSRALKHFQLILPFYISFYKPCSWTWTHFHFDILPIFVYPSPL